MSNETTFEVEITGLAHGGAGIGRVEGQVFFVPMGVPGDVLLVKVVRPGKRAQWAEIEQVLEASPARREPACPYFGECGGCDWLHMDPDLQAEGKCQIVADALARIGGVDAEVAWLDNPALHLGYRTRATFQGDGERVGFNARKTNNVVDIDRCPLCHEELNAALKQLHLVKPKGPVTITVNPEGGTPLVWSKFTNRKLKQYFPSAQSPKDPHRRERFTHGGATVVNGSFCQSSLMLNELLRGVVRDLVESPSSLLDCYCGNGNLSLQFEDVPDILGIDHGKEGIKAAYALRKGSYVTGGEAKMTQAINKGGWEVILLDPPRAGAKALMPALAKSDAARIVYVSCDPATLARDCKALVAGGWQVAEVVAIDLFPNTAHVETVCRLERA